MGCSAPGKGLSLDTKRSMPGTPPHSLAQLTLAGTLRGKRWRRQEVRACSIEHQQLRAASWVTVPLPSFSSSVLLQDSNPPPTPHSSCPTFSSCTSAWSGSVLTLRLCLLSTTSSCFLAHLPTARCPRISLLPSRPTVSPALGPQTSWVSSPVSLDVAGAQPPGSGTSGCCLQMRRTSSELLLSPAPPPQSPERKGQMRGEKQRQTNRPWIGRHGAETSFLDDFITGGR